MECLLIKGGVTQSLYNKKVGRHKSWGKGVRLSDTGLAKLLFFLLLKLDTIMSEAPC